MTPDITAENAAEAVRYIMTEYYRLNVEPFFSVLSQNCVWILPGDQVIIGAEAIRSMFTDGFRLYHLHVSNERNELTDGELFPVQVSRQTYHYVQKLGRGLSD